MRVIASVSGTVGSVRLDSAVVVVGGVGLKVQATPATVAALRVGQPADLATSLVVREDSLTLFGFADPDERDTFDLVQTVSGIGPRLALAMLAVLTPDTLRLAISKEDVNALCKVPGIGRKSAQRIILELTGRIGVPIGDGAAPAAAAPSGPDTTEVVEALTGLGWTQKQAEPAVAAAALAQPGADVATLLRAALRTLGGPG